MNYVIKNIEDYRKKRGTTMTHIAKHCDKSVAWYSDIVRGRRRVYLDDILLIAEALGEDVSIFFKKKLSETRNKANTA